MENVPSILVGVVVFLLGQYFLKLVLEPAVEVRQTIARARSVFDYHRNFAMNPPTTHTAPVDGQLAAQHAYREMAGSLRAAPAGVMGYGLVRRAFGCPSANHINRAARAFVGLSNALMGGTEFSLDHAYEYGEEIKRNLGFPD